MWIGLAFLHLDSGKVLDHLRVHFPAQQLQFFQCPQPKSFGSIVDSNGEDKRVTKSKFVNHFIVLIPIVATLKNSVLLQAVEARLALAVCAGVTLHLAVCVAMIHKRLIWRVPPSFRIGLLGVVVE
jgi:hypothetical protein